MQEGVLVLNIESVLSRLCRFQLIVTCAAASESVLSSFLFQDGRFSVLQTGGVAGWCVNPVTGEAIQTATQSTAGQLTCTYTHSNVAVIDAFAVTPLSVHHRWCV